MNDNKVVRGPNITISTRGTSTLSNFDIYEQKAKDLGVPIIPKIEPQPLQGPNPTVAICGECGIELKQIMGYCCQHANCPCGLGGTICSVT